MITVYHLRLLVDGTLSLRTRRLWTSSRDAHAKHSTCSHVAFGVVKALPVCMQWGHGGNISLYVARSCCADVPSCIVAKQGSVKLELDPLLKDDMQKPKEARAGSTHPELL